MARDGSFQFPLETHEDTYLPIPFWDWLNLHARLQKWFRLGHTVCSLKGERKMPEQKLDTRVLGRAGARVMTEEEVAKVTGSDGCHLPTSHLSRDASGRPLDITQD
jgi:hypothetical protein